MTAAIERHLDYFHTAFAIHFGDSILGASEILKLFFFNTLHWPFMATVILQSANFLGRKVSKKVTSLLVVQVEI